MPAPARDLPPLKAAATALRLLAAGFVLGFIALRWDGTTGFTGLMRFGENNAATRLPALRALPLAPSRGWGYDGQFYAQIAVQPHVTDPDLVRALDKPSYRPRRIGLPLLAHALGGGRPWAVLQAYALLGVGAWIIFAGVLWRLLPLPVWRATAAWLACVLAVGTLDSVRMALTDLPAALLLVLAARAAERGRPVAAAAWCLAAGGVREVALFGAGAVRVAGNFRRTAGLIAACAAPAVAWGAWLAWRLPGPVGHEGNLDWPGLVFGRQAALNLAAVGAGEFDSQQFFGVLGGLGLAAQSVRLLARWRTWADDPWLRIGLPFATLFWIIGTDPWLDYRAVARDCLPMTIVFNLHLAREPGASRWWWLANVSALDGVLRFTWP